jgi:signal transduction histidine kinase
MTRDAKAPNPQRDQTDESLRLERESVDLALSDELAAIEDTADAVIEKARARADEVLARARANTDRQTGRVNARSSAIVEKTRSMEDRAVRRERADADEALRTERAEHVALLSVERDETDKDLLSERARSDDALATRDAFLGIVGHDLRNMLTGMVGFAALIAKDARSLDQPERILALTQSIQRSGARMNRLIGDLVDVASIDAGVLGVAREVVDLAPVVVEALDAFQAQASARAVSLTAEIGPGSVLIAFDPARVLQVLTSNAIKFTPAGGSVVVSVRRVDDEVLISVSDTGPGIPSDQLEAVFARFVQVTKNDPRGVGLGLYISRSIVQGHGGRIWAENRVGGGVTFSFTLPIGAPMAIQAPSGADPV